MSAQLPMRELLRLAQARWCRHCADYISEALRLRYDGAGGSLAHRWALLGAVVALLVARLLGVSESTAMRLDSLIDWAMSPYTPPVP
jgi:hypothetical protein